LQVLFLKELLKNKKIQSVFFRLGINSRDFLNSITNTDEINKNFLPIIISAFELARNLNYPNINILFLLYGLRINAIPSLNEIFEKFDCKKEFLLSAILMEIYREKTKWSLRSKIQQLSIFQPRFSKKALLNPALTTRVTNILDSYSIDLTYLAEKGQVGFLVGHKEELEKIVDNLRQGDNVLLVGEEGTSKETVLMHLAWMIRNDLVPKELLDYRLVKLDLGLIYAQNKENFLPLLTKIIEDVIVSGYIILYFPYFENILLEKEVDVMQAFNEILLSKNIPIIATISPTGYLKSSTRYNLDQYFEKIEMKELSEDEAIYFLTLKSLIWEREKGIIISPQSVALAVTLAKKFIRTKVLPKSAEEIIIEAISLAKKNNSKFLNREVIQEIVAERTKIPVGDLGEAEKEKLLNLENLMHQRIVNQNYAIQQLARVLKTYRAGLEKKKGTIGAFLFVGPTGVGKTETAKALAKIYYGSEKNMIRLDMVEFQNQEDLEKLIGNTDGTFLGRLTEPVRNNPYSLILLDEFEKTHPTILKLFLPVFDEGLIKDALGREIDFTNTLIICTSNAYSELIKDYIEKGENFDKIKDELKSKLTTIFSVELLNRFDDVIIYRPLSNDELLKIAEIMINDFKTELLLKHGIGLEISLKALEEIVRLGTDPIFGARPLQRKIEEIIKAEIANLILANKINRGQKVSIDYSENFQFQII
jgi:ATP-dependent Clp protease ATP-binding subunit ClpC